MQHNIEDKEKLTTLETAWKQVESENTNKIDTIAVELLNSIPVENMKVVHAKEVNDEIEKDDIDVDENGRASGSAWTEIEARTVYSIEGVISQQVLASIQGLNDIELGNKIASILADENDGRIQPFIDAISTLVKGDLDSVYDFDFDSQSGEFNVTVKGNIDEAASSDANYNKRDAEDEAKDPYGYRGLRRSDFI